VVGEYIMNVNLDSVNADSACQCAPSRELGIAYKAPDFGEHVVDGNVVGVLGVDPAHHSSLICSLSSTCKQGSEVEGEQGREDK
jgi:hypothetical protein